MMIDWKTERHICRFKILIGILVFSGCNNNQFEIEHTEDDYRILEHYFIEPIERVDLELVNILDTDYDFQLMNADEWGAYFDLVRIDFDRGKVEVVKQDTIHPFPRKYEYRQFINRTNYAKSIDSLIDIREIWSIQDTLNSNRLIDGGDLSIILINESRVKLITWQNAERNETYDKRKVRDFYEQVWRVTSEMIENR